MSGPAKKRVQWVDTGRALAILLVVLFHAINWLEEIGVPLKAWETASLLLSSLRLPLFFTISGLFAQKWISGGWQPLWRSKLSLFVWIYGVWSIIDSFSFTLGLLIQGREPSLFAELRATLSTVWLPRFELWFIWALALLFVLGKLTRRIPPAILLTVTASVSAISFSGLLEANAGLEGLAKYAVFFLAGIHFRGTILRLGAMETHWLRALSVLAWAVVAASGVFFGLRETVFGFAFLTAIAGAFAGVSISAWLARFTLLHRLGARTLPIYVAHTSLIIVICWLIAYSPAAVRTWTGASLYPPVIAGIATLGAVWLAGVSERRAVVRYLFTQPRALAGDTKDA